MVDSKVWKWICLSLDPVERNDVQVAITHEVLHQYVCAMAYMNPMQVAERLLCCTIAVILGPSQMTKKIEAVDLMKHIDLSHVSVVAKAILWWELDEELWIFAQ